MAELSDATFEFKVSGSWEPLLGRLRARLNAPFGEGRGRQAIELLRESVAEDFALGRGKSPGGGSYSWPDTHPFGDRQSRPLPLGGPFGFLAQAWAGGRFSFSATDSRRVVIGVTHPAAPVHRGGSGMEANPGQVTNIKAKQIGAGGLPKMFWKLGLTYGAWISPKTLLGRGLNVPARPHATDNPQLREALTGLLQRSFADA